MFWRPRRITDRRVAPSHRRVNGRGRWYDTDKDEAEARRSSVVAQAQRSKAAVRKQTTGMTPDGLPVHSFRTLLADLATLARNTIITAINPNYPLTVVTRPTPMQQKAFDLLGLAL